MKQLFLTTFFIYGILTANAQTTDDTRRITITFEHGDIASSTTGRFYDGKVDRTSKPYDDNMFAVFNVESPRRDETFIESKVTEVKFTSSNGAVKKGDYVTSSAIPGTAMKATESGMVIGIATEDSNADTKLLNIQVQPGWIKK